MDTTSDTPRVVVGYDGSEHARTALGVAAEEARRRGARLDVVTAWTAPVVFAGMEVLPPPRSDYREAANELVQRAVGELPTDVQAEGIAVEGSPAASLVDAARGAALLVVGSRGRGGFAGLVLGSTSHQVTAHASCPVLVVPTGSASTRADAA